MVEISGDERTCLYIGRCPSELIRRLSQVIPLAPSIDWCQRHADSTSIAHKQSLDSSTTSHRRRMYVLGSTCKCWGFDHLPRRTDGQGWSARDVGSIDYVRWGWGWCAAWRGSWWGEGGGRGRSCEKCSAHLHLQFWFSWIFTANNYSAVTTGGLPCLHNFSYSSPSAYRSLPRRGSTSLHLLRYVDRAHDRVSVVVMAHVMAITKRSQGPRLSDRTRPWVARAVSLHVGAATTWSCVLPQRPCRLWGVVLQATIWRITHDGCEKRRLIYTSWGLSSMPEYSRRSTKSTTMM